MATIQAKTSRGQKYWYIVESRRVSGKPRPIVLAYLGKADKLLERLQGMDDQVKVKTHYPLEHHTLLFDTSNFFTFKPPWKGRSRTSRTLITWR